MKDSTRVSSHRLQHRIRPGRNKTVFRAADGYRLHHRDHCYTVTADIAGTPALNDPAPRFCARHIPAPAPAH